MTADALYNKLYLKQVDFWKKAGLREIVPVNYDYQHLVIVETGLVEADAARVVYQTHSCGCGPQPEIKGAILESELPWQDSTFRTLLEQRGDSATAGQELVKRVYRVRQAVEGAERRLVEKALASRFGAGKKIGFF